MAANNSWQQKNDLQIKNKKGKIAHEDFDRDRTGWTKGEIAQETRKIKDQIALYKSHNVRYEADKKKLNAQLENYKQRQENAKTDKEKRAANQLVYRAKMKKYYLSEAHTYSLWWVNFMERYRVARQRQQVAYNKKYDIGEADPIDYMNVIMPKRIEDLRNRINARMGGRMGSGPKRK